MTINNLRDSANGTFVTRTITSTSQVTSPTPWSSLTSRSSMTRSSATSLTSRIPLAHFAPSSDHNVDDETLGKLLAEVHRDYAYHRRPEGVSVSPSSMSVMVDRTGEPVERSDSDHFGFSVRNVKKCSESVSFSHSN